MSSSVIVKYEQADEPQRLPTETYLGQAGEVVPGVFGRDGQGPGRTVVTASVGGMPVCAALVLGVPAL